MSKYIFETSQFGISDIGIHLLRNRFNYQVIKFKEISEIKLTDGPQSRNWILLTIIGISLLAFGLFTSFKVIYEFFFANNFTDFYIEQFLLPILPILFGGYFTYTGLKRGSVLMVTSLNSKKNIFFLDELEKNNHLNDLPLFFQTNEFTNKVFSV